MIHYTYNSAPFLQNLNYLKLFFGTTALAAKVPAESSEHHNQAVRQSKHRNQAGEAHEYVGPFFYHSIWHSIKHVGTFSNKRDWLALQQNSGASERPQRNKREPVHCANHNLFIEVKSTYYHNTRGLDLFKSCY